MQMALLSTDSVLRYASFFDETTSKDVKSLADWKATQGEARTTVYSMLGRNFNLNPVRGRLGSTYYLTKMSYMRIDLDFTSDNTFSLSAIPMESGVQESNRRGSGATLQDVGPSWAGGYGVTFATTDVTAVYIVPQAVRDIGGSARISIPPVGMSSRANTNPYPTTTTVSMLANAHTDTTNGQNAAYGYNYNNSTNTLNFTMDAGISINVSTLKGISFCGVNRSTSFPAFSSGTTAKRTARLPIVASTDESVNISWAAIVVYTGASDFLMYLLDESEFTVPESMIPGDVYQGSFSDNLPLVRIPAAIYNL